jgi:hypothetical protein
LQWADDKDALRRVQQVLCDTLDALAHIYVSEAWISKSDTTGVALCAAGQSLELHPQRREAIIVYLEHTEGFRFWSVPILRDGDNASLGATEEHLDSVMEGRMTGYITTPNTRSATEA